ncbi:MAG: FumA C-terminus/TtdB family hydratase beta subunit [Ignisphaera sp.]|nr:FumA C-terminus/TtdB family hydratase beta subunit [Ignisphaera sp.]MCX8167725.1 FumA C-terminus/TtdB family hydratase beta subunit [Ignisphaera sp.]MDW8085289.1 FumA C-terminus/TtdB family hydratase beta subunit [Ignisphaera sp.]
MTVFHLRTPLQVEDVRKLRVSDVIYLSGIIVTARDAAHRRMIEHLRNGRPIPVDLNGGVIYHCGPVVERVDNEWIVISGGPTTSARMELYEADIIRHFGVRLIIGKGGMGAKTAQACREFGAIYATFTGGAGVLAANAIRRVVKAEWLDLGIPEALWILEVENFGPLLVTIDTTGRNLTEEVIEMAKNRRDEILKKLEAI